MRLGDDLPGLLRQVGQILLGHAEVHRQRHQALLRPVMQVTFDASSLRVSGVHHTSAAL
jgi:hypothetical protein